MKNKISSIERLEGKEDKVLLPKEKNLFLAESFISIWQLQHITVSSIDLIEKYKKKEKSRRKKTN